jgi:glycosyltransferase involved in cell wall biosynthesis/SAM-dependent methyltransferase
MEAERVATTLRPNASVSTAAEPLIRLCPICEGTRLHYTFSKQEYRFVRCQDCLLMFLNPPPGDQFLQQLRSSVATDTSETPALGDHVSQLRRATARLRLEELGRYRGEDGGDLLHIGCGAGNLLLEAADAGFAVTGVEAAAAAAGEASRRLAGRGQVLCGGLPEVARRGAQYDVCIVSGSLERARAPIAFLAQVRDLLRPGGTLLIETPALDSWSARLLRQNWFEFSPEHLFYFDTATIQHALHKAGFHEALVRPAREVLSLSRAARALKRFEVPVVSRLTVAASRAAPGFVRFRQSTASSSRMVAFARPRPARATPKVSVIVPAYNEVATLAPLLDSVLRKDLGTVELQVVLVESGSSDGTREVARSYAAHPRVRLVLEERPLGKGHAVRTGLAHADGDFVLIQDADLEYDVEDYDSLLEPLLRNREAFVLGSRHGGAAWKMRRFTGQWLLSSGLNFGHWFFTTLINVLFWQKLRDPFTMYKVFRRDCLFGLEFECNRFDFDYELLIKLVRKGYRPLEIPVNYRSRSFREGKKVSMWRDPLTWLRVLAKLRLCRVDPLEHVDRRKDRPRGSSTRNERLAG